MSTALRSVGFLDVLSSPPAESSRRAPCSHARLRRLATKPGEKCGLAGRDDVPSVGNDANDAGPACVAGKAEGSIVFQIPDADTAQPLSAAAEIPGRSRS